MLSLPDWLSDICFVGWTPFLVALHRRHWDTARLVLAIATAQYQSPETETVATANPIIHGNYLHIPALAQGLSHLAWSDDSDSDEEGEHDEDEDDCSDYSEQKTINFTDIAARPSSVRVDVPPTKMLEVLSPVLREGRKYRSCNPLQKAIVENDFEAFLRTLDLYDFAGMEISPNSGAYNLAVTLDRPEMVDELIRRSGVGIPVPSDSAKSFGAGSKVSEERVYLGLKVGGKRRTDFVKHKTKLKAPTHNYDLLRSAICSGSTKVIDYLAGPRPTAAFMHFAETHNGDIAQGLKSVDNLGDVLPDLLGWKSDELNESPLLSAVVYNRLDVLKQMFALKPSSMEEALHLRCG